MNRPYIVCHMSASLDGKITGSYMLTPEAESAFEEYERINQFYQPQAWINGRVTIDENFTFYEKPELPENVPVIPHDDYAVIGDFENYIAAVDPSGRLGWKQNYVEYAGRPKAHVIEILTEQVSDAYLVFLQEKKISYIFAGTDTIDFTVAVKKLKLLFGIEKLKLSGGGILNWSFAQAWLIDELNGASAKYVHYVPEQEEINEKTYPDMVVGNQYYRNEAKHPNSPNLFRFTGLANRMTFDAYEFIPQYLDRPLLVINGSKAGSLWQSIKAYELSNGPKELWVVENAGHFDFYNNPVCIEKTVDKIAEFFGKTLVSTNN